MAAIPQHAVTQDDLNKWSELQAQLLALKSAEMLLRTKIFKGLFPEPVEGTNSVPLGTEGWVIKAKYPITRKPDVALLTAKAGELRAAGIVLENVIRTIPELATGEYRKLTDDQRHLLDQVLEIKPGSPSLEIVLPKRAKVN
jgi:hypothetical protein